MNPSWLKWIFASLAKHFDDNRGGIDLQIEDTDKKPLTREQAELRINGPFISHLNFRTYKIELNVNVLIKVTPENRIYRNWEIQGIFIKAMADSIPVYKYGDTDADDQSLLGCLILRADRGADIFITQYDQISPDIKMYESTLDGFYEIELKT